MPLEVIGAGFGRTGTNSLKVALETLGYQKCHHMKEVIPSRKQSQLWARVADGEKVSWDEVFEGFAAAVDWPSAAYYQALAEYYPEAKVVLSVRDPEKWYVSARETIYPLSHSFPRWIMFLSKPSRRLRDAINGIVWDGVFDGRFEEKEHAIRIFNEHIDEVKRVIPGDRLLIHEAKDGWDPLCAFLGKPVPSTPYPRVNEAKDLKRAVIAMQWLDRLPWFLLGALILLLLFYLISAI